MKNNEPLTPAEHRRVQAANRTREWRDAKPENQRKYEEHLKRNNERKERRKIQKLKSYTGK